MKERSSIAREEFTMGLFKYLKDRVFIEDPVRDSLEDIRKKFISLENKAGVPEYEKIKYDIDTKILINRFNKQQIVNITQMVTSIALVILTIILVYTTYTLQGATKTLNNMMPEMMPKAQSHNKIK